MTQESVQATLFRGGTTKGVFFEEKSLPAGRERRDELLLRSFGSPDPKQLDGVGGSHSTASKAMLISTPTDPDIDVEYLFAQVGIEKPVVDWGGNCGNLTYAVGPYALERGLIDPAPADGAVELVLRNANTGTVVDQSIPVEPDGMPRYRGDFRVHGVPGSGARIRSRFRDPGGSVTGETFPTGNRVDVLEVDELGELEVSLVDVSNPCVFARAADVGLTAAETPEEIDADPAILDRLESIRSTACARLGFVDDPTNATRESPGIPKMAIVGERTAYRTTEGETVDPDSFDLLARTMSMQKAHHAYAVTGAMCTAAAAVLGGTVPAEYLAEDRPTEVVIGHPKGTMSVGVELRNDEVVFTRVDRTARQLMHGDLYFLPQSYMAPKS